jgi:Tfp pilus assembly protein PilN
MDAVNLIPADARKRRAISASPATLGLIGGLLVLLVAAVLYVSAENNVTARKSELAQVTASVTRWQASANSYASLVQSAREQDQQLGAVRQLAATRFPWSLLLGQIGDLMPARAALSSLQATTPASTSTSTSAAGSSSTGASTAATASTPPAPTVQLSGCAQSQATVAQTMVQLHRISGVSAVLLASSTDSSAGSAGATGGSAGQSGGCPFPVAFQVSLTFAPPSGAVAATTGSTPAASTSTPTASAATTTTGTSR